MKRRKRLWKRWGAGLCAVCLAAAGAPAGGVPGGRNGISPDGLPGNPAGGLAGYFSAGVPGSVARAEEEDVAMGRYLETDVALPEECGELRDVVRTTEGTIRIIGQNQEADHRYRIWDSADGGATWEQTGELSGEGTEEWFSDIDLSPDGGGVAVGLSYSGGTEEASAADSTADAGGDSAMDSAADAGEGSAADVEEGSAADDTSGASTGQPEYSYYILSFDAQGNVTCRAEGDDLYMMEFAQNGQLAGFTMAGNVNLFDRDTCEATLMLAENADMIAACGQEILVFADTQLQRYDMASGEPLARDEALEDALFQGAGEHAYAITSSYGVPIVMTEDEEGRLYYATRDGIFAHVMGGGVVEQAADGALCSLQAPDVETCSMAVLDQCFYLVVFGGNDGSRLLKYQYSADVPSVPQNEITVYSMYEDDNLRQVITQFQKLHPDTYVNFEIGMSGDDGVTVSDALRTLNTEILAGSGPDVLLLDGFAIDTYVEQGLLADLSGIAGEIKDSEGLMENVSGVFEREGVLPAIPARFGIVTAVGDPELAAGIDSPDALESVAAQEGALDAFQVSILPDILYRVCAGAWKNEDGTLNQEKLADYVNAVVRITDAWTESATEEELENLRNYQSGERYNWGVYQEIGLKGDDIGLVGLELLMNPHQVRLGALYRMWDYCGLTSMNKETGCCSVLQPELSGEKFFVPCCVLGIVSTSRAQEQAGEFVKYVLSAEGQKMADSDGFPVNRTAFDAMLSDGKGNLGGVSSSYGDEYFSLDYTWPSQEELDALSEMAQQVTAPVEDGRVQHDVVLEEMKRCLNGETSADEAVNAIMQRINLYLAE